MSLDIGSGGGNDIATEAGNIIAKGPDAVHQAGNALASSGGAAGSGGANTNIRRIARTVARNRHRPTRTWRRVIWD
jgi:hypothetical protein